MPSLGIQSFIQYMNSDLVEWHIINVTRLCGCLPGAILDDIQAGSGHLLLQQATGPIKTPVTRDLLISRYPAQASLPTADNDGQVPIVPHSHMLG